MERCRIGLSEITNLSRCSDLRKGGNEKRDEQRINEWSLG